MTRSRRAVVLTLLALILGLVLGATISARPIASTLADWIEPIGLLWVNAIRMTVIPLIVAALIVAVAGAAPQTLGHLGIRTFAVFVALLASLLTTFPVTPAGLGAVESGTILALKLFDATANKAASVALVDRAIAYWSVILIGGLVYLFSKRK